MKPRSPRHASAGFSLVEVLLAMIIVSIGLLGILVLLTASMRSAAGSRGRETAVYLAQTVADNIQSEAQRVSLANVYATPAANSAVLTYFGAAEAGILYYDVNGTLTTAANGVFRVDWARLSTRDATPNTNEFVVNVAWTFETDSRNVNVTRTVQINRIVRLDVAV